MSTTRDGREVIPSGEQPLPGYRHLLPIAKFLIEERGHMALQRPEKWGFIHTGTGMACHLSRKITDADWAAVNDRFALPDHIGFRNGLIRDNLNRVDLMGHDEFSGLSGVEPIEVWEARLRGE